MNEKILLVEMFQTYLHTYRMTECVSEIVTYIHWHLRFIWLMLTLPYWAYWIGLTSTNYTLHLWKLADSWLNVDNFAAMKKKKKFNIFSEIVFLLNLFKGKQTYFLLEVHSRWNHFFFPSVFCYITTWGI